MKRNPRMQSLVAQFSYDHKNISKRLKKIHQSADELNKFLNNMPPKKGKKEADKKENEKK